MRILSFRTRIALLSLLISGAVLVAFGFSFLRVIQKVGLDRVDNELSSLAESQLRGHHPPEHWELFDQSLGDIYGEEQREQRIILLEDDSGQELYRSPHWPEGLLLPDFPPLEYPNPPPTSSLRPGGPPPGRGGPPLGPGGPPREHQPPSFPQFRSITAGDSTYRVCRMGNQRTTLTIGLDLAAHRAETNRFRNTFFTAALVALLLLALGGWILARQALAPVAAITATASKVTARGLDQRIPQREADVEFERLTEVINSMLGRLERSFQQAARFSADAAHELKTPLTILQGELDQALQSAEPGSGDQQRFGDLLEEVQRLKAIVKKLLILSQADAGELNLSLEPIDISRELSATAEDLEIVAPSLEVHKDLPPGIKINADPDLLRQVISNLVSNAVKYNREGGWIEMRLEQDGTSASFTISNSGDAIPSADRELIFHRFHRVDPARSKVVEGTGLGLSLAHEIARAHGGDLVLSADAEDRSTFILTLPLARTAN